MRDGWQRIALRDVLTQVSRPVTVAELDDVPFAGVRWYAEGVYARDVVSAHEVKTKTLNRLKAGDITYNRMWATKASFGRAGMDVNGCLVTNDFPIFEVDATRVVGDYIQLIFKNAVFQREAFSRATGTTERRRLKERDFLSIVINLPPLAEQRRMVDLIGAVDEAIDAADAVADLYQNTSTELATNEFSVLTAESMVPLVPLGQLAESRLGKMLSSSTNTGDEYPYLRNADVQWGTINLRALKTMPLTERDILEYSVLQGDLLVCEGGEVGRCAVVEEDLDGIYFQKALHRVRCGQRLRARFLQVYLQYLASSAGLDNYTGGSTIPHLTGEKLRTILVPVPALEAQDEIVERLGAARRCAEVASDMAASLRSLRDNLLTALLCGQHEIPQTYDRLLVSTGLSDSEVAA